MLQLRPPQLPTRPAAVALLLLFTALIACSPGGDRGRRGRGVLFIVIDSLRADHLGSAGYDRETTPELDELAQRGISFSQAFSAAPELIASNAALLTGCDPYIVRLPLPEEPGFLSISQKWHLPDPAPSLAAEFLADGYATAAFSDHGRFSKEHGFARGFERFDPFQGGTLQDEIDFGAASLGRRLLDWIRTLERKRDWFAYVTINDLERSLRLSDERWRTYFDPREELSEVPPISLAPRAFFAIPRRQWSGALLTVGEYEASYDYHLRALDAKLGRLFALLESMGRLEETTICIVGSYGVGFGEAGLYLDHGSLADVDLAVPWILVPPTSSDLPRGLRTNTLASTTDIAPTLLEIAGIPVPAGTHGVSQVPALRPEGAAVREYVFSKGGLSEGFSVRDERYSYQATTHAMRGGAGLISSWYGTPKLPARSTRRHLRDRQSDAGPGDLAPSTSNPERAETLDAVGKEWFAWMEHARNALHDPPWLDPPVSAEVRAELVRRGLIP